jgi:hypothetical protein
VTDPLLDVADGLYALPPGDFTAARDALVKEHKTDKAFAGAVKAMTKPSVAAFVVNLLVRREADQVAQVLAVGESLREAAQALDGDELRSLTRQRRQLTAAVTQVARSVAGDEGVKVSQAVADQVEATLTAAMLDPVAAQAVRSGLLVQALRSTGLGEEDVASAVALPAALGFAASPRAAAERPRPALTVVPDPEPDETARREAEEALAAADAALTAAEGEAAAASGTVAELEARTLQVQAEIAELRTRLADLEEQAEAVDEDLDEAQAVAAEAARRRTAAAKDRERAQAALDALTTG